MTCDLCGTCPDCRALAAAMLADPFPPPPDTVGRSPLTLPASGGGPLQASPVDRITRSALAFLAHPAAGVVLGAALVVLGALNTALVLVLP